MLAPLLLSLALLQAPADPEPPTLRLPSTVVPLEGALDLAVDPAGEHHSGEARYTVRLDAPTSVIWLHAAAEMDVGRATVGGRLARVVRKPGDLVGLVLDAPAPAGTTALELAFTGEVDRVRSRGLYAVAEGDWYAYTFFEPVDARRAFPCFDEPWAKIPWRLTLRVPKGNRAFANAPVEAEEDLGKDTRVTFARSRPLPTYLVAFVVGPFDVVDGGTGGAAKVPVRFLVPKGRGTETAYAASVTGRMLDLLEQATGVPYPYEKCDVAVVPRFWGTMEHPGIVALGQPLTLIKKEDDSRQRRERYAQIAIHELAHHWFGDLVTMAWWDDTWLNESFGSWIDAPVTDALEPSWRHLLEARVGGRAQALAADGLPSAKAIRQPVASAHDIEGSFDNAITYAKGSTVLAMFEAYVGQDRFRAAVKRHLEAKAHGTATTDDLVLAFGQELGADVAGALRGFVERPGAPLLAVEKACGPGGAKAVVSQSRFLVAGGTAPPASTAAWTVPLCVKLGAKGKEPAVVCGLAGAPRTELALPYCPDWLFPNARGTGYWVSALPAKGLDALAARLDPREQLTLANDAGLLADRGDLPVEAALSLGLALAASRDRMGVQAALGLLSRVNHDALSPRDRARHEQLLSRTFGPRARAMGWLPREGDDAEANALRRLVLQAAARGGKDPVLVKEARGLADAWLGDRGAVPPEVSQAALGVAARFGDRALLERIVEEAARAEDRTERTQLLAALGEFRDPALAREVLSLVVPPGTAAADAGPQFDLRETLPILRAQLAHAETQPIAWKVLVSRWDAIAASTRSDDGIGLTVSAATGACVPSRRAEIAEFLTPRAEHFEGAPRALARALEAADLCAATRARNAKGVSAFLARNVRK